VPASKPILTFLFILPPLQRWLRKMRGSELKPLG
jgi:hypothetical protein